MKISTKGRYGLEALVELALHASEGPVSLKSISERSNLPEAYILQIFLVLRRAGIVQSVRGAQGGYVLAKSPQEIRAFEVLEAVEGPLVPVACLEKNCTNTCERVPICATRFLWERVSKELSEVAQSVTLEDLVKAYYTLSVQKNACPDYAI